MGDVSVKDKVIDLLSGALHMAASGGHTEIIKYLQGCDVSVKDKVIDLLSGALHMAASGGHTEIIKYLQSKGCDVMLKTR